MLCKIIIIIKSKYFIQDMGDEQSRGRSREDIEREAREYIQRQNMTDSRGFRHSYGSRQSPGQIQPRNSA